MTENARHPFAFVANDLWLRRYPLKILGANFGRHVTLIRIGPKILVHSTAPFSEEDLHAIRHFGAPAWLLDATNNHDTFAAKGRSGLPEALYLAPPGFPGVTHSLSDPPPEWSGIIDVMELQGMPKTREHVMLHRPSRTLIVADLIFNPSPWMNGWTRFLLRTLSGLKSAGVSKLFLTQVKDRAAFAQSIRQLLQWDFDRLIPGHGNHIETGAKQLVTDAFKARGIAVD